MRDRRKPTNDELDLSKRKASSYLILLAISAAVIGVTAIILFSVSREIRPLTEATVNSEPIAELTNTKQAKPIPTSPKKVENALLDSSQLVPQENQPGSADNNIDSDTDQSEEQKLESLRAATEQKKLENETLLKRSQALEEELQQKIAQLDSETAVGNDNSAKIVENKYIIAELMELLERGDTTMAKAGLERLLSICPNCVLPVQLQELQKQP